MTWFTQDTAPTQYAEGGGIRFAYRRLGIPERPPLLFFQHFTGTLDDHDPTLSDAFTSHRASGPQRLGLLAGRPTASAVTPRATPPSRAQERAVPSRAAKHWKDSPHADD